MKADQFSWLWTGGVILLCVVSSLFFLRTVLFRSIPLTIGDEAWNIEVARTEAERSRGLAYRDEICRSCGMLFIFDQPGVHQFWMRGMRFPLDIIFIAEGKVLSIERRIDPADARIFAPPGSVKYVLEVNAGEADRVQPGMMVFGLSQ